MNKNPKILAAPGDFGTGSVSGHVLRLAFPIITAQFINLLYSIVDRIWLGRWQTGSFGSAALAGVGLAFPVIAIITAFTSLCSTGAVPLFNIARGKGERERAGRIMGNALTSLLVLSFVLTAAVLLFLRPILFIVGASDGTIEYAADYLSIYICGTAFAMAGLGMNGFINAQGFGRVGMGTVLVGAVINIILDPILIFGFDMGVRGAAVATVFAQGCSALFAVSFLCGRRALIPVTPERMRPDFAQLRRQMALGAAGFTMAMTNSLVAALYNVTLQNLGGDIYVSAMVIVHSIQEIVQLPGMGLSQSAQPVMSFNYGAGQNDRVKRVMRFLIIGSLSLFSLMWIVVMLFPEQLIRVFSDDTKLIDVGVGAVRSYFMIFFFMSLQNVGQSGFVSLGMTKHAVFFSALRKAVIVSPFILMLGYGVKAGAAGVFYAEPISHLFGSTACFLVFMLTVYKKRLRPDENNHSSA